MFAHAILLIQDVQLVCFTVVFGVLALQRWSDQTRRWMWYGFLANAAGAAIDLMGHVLPAWIGNGLEGEMIPLSYAFLNVAFAHFDRRGKLTGWISSIPLLVGLPFFLAWRNDPVRIHSNVLIDLLIALECMITITLLLGRKERSTWAPRLLMGGFLIYFVVIELVRVWVAFPMHSDPDLETSRLAMVSTVTYVVNVSLLPLAFIWMMQSRLEWELLQLSIVDPLTQVLNRRGLEQALGRELARCRRYGEELIVAMLDLDHFKRINDKYGHAAGDALLTNVAGFLTKRIRETDTLGRFGGEEFVLLLPHGDIAQCVLLLEQLRKGLQESRGLLPSADIHITASFGVTSTHGRSNVEAGDLLREADIALYRAKEDGRNQVRCFQPVASAGMQADL